MNYIQLPMMCIPIILLAAVWSIFWKGIALWRAARNNHGGWFAALLLINTLGILDIFYIFSVAKVKADRLFKK